MVRWSLRGCHDRPRLAVLLVSEDSEEKLLDKELLLEELDEELEELEPFRPFSRLRRDCSFLARLEAANLAPSVVLGWSGGEAGWVVEGGGGWRSACLTAGPSGGGAPPAAGRGGPSSSFPKASYAAFCRRIRSRLALAAAEGSKLSSSGNSFFEESGSAAVWSGAAPPAGPGAAPPRGAAPLPAVPPSSTTGAPPSTSAFRRKTSLHALF